LLLFLRANVKFFINSFDRIALNLFNINEEVLMEILFKKMMRNAWMVLALTVWFAWESPAQVAGKPFKVVIDPGHGGKDSGTKGTGRTKIYEKDVVLAIGKEIKKLLGQKDPSIQVIMTRDTDKFVELRKRADIANKNKADLFVSLHCNANPNKRVRGSETYVLGIHRNKDNLEVAKKENAVIKLEDNYQVNYKGFDPDAPETFIGLELMQEEFLEQSILLASLIQKEYQQRVHTKNRSVQQAGFAVLRLTYMPSVLTEVGFLSNPEEEKFLQSKEGQHKIAESIVEAILKYKRLIMQNSALPVAAPADTAVTETTAPSESSSSASATKAPSSVKCADCFFSVQIFMSKSKLPSASKRFKGLKPVFAKQMGGYYKYFYGRTKNWAEAKKLLSRARKAGFKDAFLVGFKDGRRVPVRTILKK